MRSRTAGSFGPGSHSWVIIDGLIKVGILQSKIVKFCTNLASDAVAAGIIPTNPGQVYNEGAC